MNTFEKLGVEAAQAICYSGFRDGQHPGGSYPSYEEVKEDLLMLQGHWKYLRLYDCDEHAKTVLDVITQEKLDFKLMISAYIEAEMNNFNCPWGGGVYTEEELEKNTQLNKDKIDLLINWANTYSDIVFCLSVGNEATVDWTDHYVHEDLVTEYVKYVQKNTFQPVTFCENYVPWLIKLEGLAEAVDFISIHTYPVWEYKHIDEALDYTKHNYYSVAEKYPDTPVVITEAGWATNSNGRGIDPYHVSELHQKVYFEKMMEWCNSENILTFFFEAFDENWKGSDDEMEPEKHWGLFKADRSPKEVMKQHFPKG